MCIAYKKNEKSAKYFEHVYNFGFVIINDDIFKTKMHEMIVPRPKSFTFSLNPIVIIISNNKRHINSIQEILSDKEKKSTSYSAKKKPHM